MLDGQVLNWSAPGIIKTMTYFLHHVWHMELQIFFLINNSFACSSCQTHDVSELVIDCKSHHTSRFDLVNPTPLFRDSIVQTESWKPFSWWTVTCLKENPFLLVSCSMYIDLDFWLVLWSYFCIISFFYKISRLCNKYIIETRGFIRTVVDFTA